MAASVLRRSYSQFINSYPAADVLRFCRKFDLKWIFACLRGIKAICLSLHQFGDVYLCFRLGTSRSTRTDSDSFIRIRSVIYLYKPKCQHPGWQLRRISNEHMNFLSESRTQINGASVIAVVGSGQLGAFCARVLAIYQNVRLPLVRIVHVTTLLNPANILQWRNNSRVTLLT